MSDSEWQAKDTDRHVRTVQCTEFEKLIHSRELNCWIIMSLENRSIRSSNSISITKLRVDHIIVIVFFISLDYICYNL